MAPVSAPILGSLKEPIMEILRKSDLSSVSAKSVRQSLVNLSDPMNPNEKLLARLQIRLDDKEQKKQIDELIRSCFDDINNPPLPPVQVPQKSNNNHATGLALPMGNGQSSSSINGHAAPKLALPGMGGIPGSHAAKPVPHSSSSSSISASGGGGGKRSRKEDTISDDEEDGDTETIRKKASAAATKKKSTKKQKSGKNENGEKTINPNNPFNKPVVLSEEMSRVCGGKEMPRYEITKKLWAYIKARDLQNPENKRQILCDDTLTSLFGKNKVDSFEMAKLISNHVTKKDA